MKLFDPTSTPRERTVTLAPRGVEVGSKSFMVAVLTGCR